jgi:hypothetical protein
MTSVAAAHSRCQRYVGSYSNGGRIAATGPMTKRAKSGSRQSCELRRPVIVIEAKAPGLVVVLRDKGFVQKDTTLTRRVVVEDAKYSVSEPLVESARLKAVRIQPCASTTTSFRFLLCLKQHLSTETGASQRLRDK